jgi:hypothetical protein
VDLTPESYRIFEVLLQTGATLGLVVVRRPQQILVCRVEGDAMDGGGMDVVVVARPHESMSQFSRAVEFST